MSRDVVSFTVAGQLFGIPVERVRDALSGRHPTPIPLAPDDVAGALNLHGRIVTAIDLRRRLGLAPPDAAQGAADGGKGVVVAQGPDLYSLMVDALGEVLPLAPEGRTPPPPDLDPRLGACAEAVYRLEDGLLVVLDVDRLMACRPVVAATAPGRESPKDPGAAS